MFVSIVSIALLVIITYCSVQLRREYTKRRSVRFDELHRDFVSVYGRMVPVLERYLNAKDLKSLRAIPGPALHIALTSPTKDCDVEFTCESKLTDIANKYLHLECLLTEVDMHFISLCNESMELNEKHECLRIPVMDVSWARKQIKYRIANLDIDNKIKNKIQY